MSIRVETVHEQSLVQIAPISPPSHRLLLQSHQREVAFRSENPCLMEQGTRGQIACRLG